MKIYATRAQGVRFFEYSARVSAFILFTICVGSAGRAQTTDQTPPSAPTGLVASAAGCGQVDLSWGASSDNVGGSGLKAYSVWRSNDGVNTVTSIGAVRTTFSDTVYVKSSTSFSYYVVAQDNAGNISAASNTVAVATAACPTSSGEQIVDSSESGPLGKSVATYGTRTAMIYQKLNAYSTRDAWLYVSDSDTGQTSRFLLHSSPGYSQVESDYVLTSASDLWTLSNDTGSGGHLLVSHYQLNGSLPTSTTLLSTQALGDNISEGRSMIRLQSGGLLVGWSEGIFSDPSGSQTDLKTGFAYRSPAGGAWAVHFPITVPNNNGGGNIVQCRMAMAQHPLDRSIWVFLKRDSFSQISALHFTEASNDVTIDAITPAFITTNTDGNNGPELEFPYLAASPDPTRSAILLAYQDYQQQVVFQDPLYGSLSNNIFLKQAQASIAQVSVDASKTFITFPTYMERITQFGMSVLSDGSIWLAYQPINSQTLTWNEVYVSNYQNGVWSAPALSGLDYNNYNNASGLDISLVYRADQPWVAFLTPDQKIHTFDLSNLGAAPGDTTPPTTSITNPASGTTVSGTVSVSASAADNVGVTSVQLLADGVVIGTSASAPYNFAWSTTALANGNHTLQTQALDAAGNTGNSTPVTVTVSNLTSSSLTVAVTNPKNGSAVPRNQKVTVSAAASDTIAVTKMEFYVNNNLLGTTTIAPYTYPWRVPGKRGQYQIQAKAYDAAGKSAAQSITVTAQ